MSVQNPTHLTDYNAHDWSIGHAITDERMNNIEIGIDNLNQEIRAAYRNDTDDTLKQRFYDIEKDVDFLQANVYGIKFDKINNQCTRLWAAKDITTDTTNFTYNGSINSNYNNPFDNIYPWSEFKLCNVDLSAYRNLTSGSDIRDCVTAWYGDPDFTDSDPTKFVGRYRPEYWYIGYEENDYQIYAISDKEILGWGYSPACIDSFSLLNDDGSNSTGTNNTGTVTCYAGAQPLTNIALSNIHARAKNTGITLQNIYTISSLITACIVEFADMNIQSKIGNGISSVYRQNENDRPLIAEEGATRVVLPSACASYALVGATLDFGASNGAVVLSNRRICTGYESYPDNANYISVKFDTALNVTTSMYVSFHGKVNSSNIGNKSGYIGTNGQTDAFYRGAVIYGNRFRYILGAYRQTGTGKIWICNNINNCDNYDTIDTTNHINTDCILPENTSNYIKTLYVLPKFGFGALPFGKDIAGNSSAPIGDYLYVPAATTANTILLLGGAASGGLRAGPFYGHWNGTASNSHWYNAGAAVLLPK